MKAQINVLALLAVTLPSFGQGTLYFKNDESSLIKAGSDFGPVPVGAGSTFVQLFWSRTGTGPVAYDPATMTPYDWYSAHHGGWTLAGTPTLTGPELGLFDGGTLTLPTETPGRPILAVVVAWPAQYPTLEDTWNYPYAVGVSDWFAIDTGDPTSTPPGTPSSLTDTSLGKPFTGVTIPVFIPEPSAAGLIAMGAAGLWWLRRRQ